MKNFSILVTYFFLTSIGFANEKLIKSIDLKIQELGEYSEIKNYPIGFFDVVAKHCKEKKNFGCIKTDVQKNMSVMFNRGEAYNQNNPENQLYAMALFEIFYLDNLDKNKRPLTKFKSGWPKKTSNGKTVSSLIKLNETRKKMRKAVGLSLSNSPEEAMNAYWNLGTFLSKGTVQKQKVSNEYKEKKKVLDSYSNSIAKLKSAIQNQELEEIYEYLK